MSIINGAKGKPSGLERQSFRTTSAIALSLRKWHASIAANMAFGMPVRSPIGTQGRNIVLT
jgi:hypothetical protein